MSIEHRFWKTMAVSLNGASEQDEALEALDALVSLEALGIHWIASSPVPEDLSLPLTREVDRYFKENQAAREAVIEASPYRARHGNNEDVFVSVMGSDTDFEYYDQALSDRGRERGNMFLYSDNLNHPICRRLMQKYNMVITSMLSETHRVQLATACKHLVLSWDPFSRMVGVLAFHAETVCVPRSSPPEDLVEGWTRADDAVAIDVVIPLGPNDVGVIRKQLSYTRRNIVGLRRIYVVSTDPSLDLGDDVVVIPETAFPMTMADVVSIINFPERNGWYLQQLIKLYAWKAIRGLSSRYLVLDADTFFLRPTRFVNEDRKSMYAFGHEYHEPYFDHMVRLSPVLQKVTLFSGIVHHMLMETNRVIEMMEIVSETHPAVPFWEAFLKTVHWDKEGSGASEYEMYFNFILRVHPDTVSIRPLKWTNVASLEEESTTDHDFVSYHWYSRET
jgi:hypothetical protein